LSHFITLRRLCKAHSQRLRRVIHGLRVAREANTPSRLRRTPPRVPREGESLSPSAAGWGSTPKGGGGIGYKFPISKRIRARPLPFLRKRMRHLAVDQLPFIQKRKLIRKRENPSIANAAVDVMRAQRCG
jgi:hypothetical protein